MATVDIHRLFDLNRCPPGLALLPILLYMPLGLALVVVRLFIGLQTYLIASVLGKTSIIRCLVLRVMCGVLGILVTQCGREKQTSLKPKVIVANYRSTLDHVAIELIHPNIMISVWDLPAVLMWLLGYRDMGAQLGQDTLISNIKRHCRDSDLPVLAFPEGATTSGKAGLLKFSVWSFSLDEPIQPVVIQIVRPPMFSISPTVLYSAWWADVLWFLFVPYSLFRIRFLDPVRQSKDETAQEFARRVQMLMAESLGVTPTSYTSADKVDLMKQLSSNSNSHKDDVPARSNSTDTLMDSMVNQIKVVLPHVPTDAIRADLELTKDIDLTITNILEGRVEYIASEPSVEAQRSDDTEDRSEVKRTRSSESMQSNASVGRTTPRSAAPISPYASATFAKTSNERQQSFEERKKAMLETARRRYLDKTATTN